MEVATITMDPEEAKAKLKAFRSQLHRDADGVYQAAAEGYKALAEGKQLIELSKAIQAGGFDEEMRPRIAIGRSDRKEVEFSWPAHALTATFSTSKNRNRASETMDIRVPMGRQHGLTYENKNGIWGRSIIAYAMVPMIPADVIPTRGQRRDWHILWEVDHWSDRPQTAWPSRDPFLLKHIGGDLWAVLAEWDLTPLEMAVMRGLRG